MRWRRLFFLGLALITFMLLAAGLSSVQPQHGEIVFAPRQERLIDPFVLRETTVTPGNPNPGNPLYYVALIAALSLALYAFYRSPQLRRVMLILLVFWAFLMAAVYLYRVQFSTPNDSPPDAEVFLYETPERPPEELFNNPPDWADTLSLITTLAVLAFTGLMIGLIRRIRRYRKPPLELVAQEAEATLAEIRAGAEVKDAVMRCYLDMSRALQRQRGLVRQEGMTPREFEEELIGQGLPSEAVARLTRLFERVRYGGQPASEHDKQEAVAALEAIVTAVRQPEKQEPATAVGAFT